jgi:ribose 5-phosphate isomerase B
LGCDCKDFGTHSTESCDYPVITDVAGRAVASGECDIGIFVCTTGVGMSIAANKIRGIRAALCTDGYTAEMARRHNNANVLVLGGRVVGAGVALKTVDAFLAASFEGGRHGRRVDMIGRIENGESP